MLVQLKEICYGGKCFNSLWGNGGAADDLKGIDYRDFTDYNNYAGVSGLRCFNQSVLNLNF